MDGRWNCSNDGRPTVMISAMGMVVGIAVVVMFVIQDTVMLECVYLHLYTYTYTVYGRMLMLLLYKIY